MIPCSKCGHNNRLGAIFCAACGEKLTLNIMDVEQSVIATKDDDAANKVFNAGRNTLGLAVFLVFSAYIFRHVVVPDPPKVLMPEAAPMAPEELFAPAIPNWLQPGKADEPTLKLADVAQSNTSLMSWRRAQNDFVLGSTPANITNIANWQIEIYNSRVKEGTWKGPDPVAANGLAILALLAYPSQPEFNLAVEDAVKELKPMIIRGSSRRHPIAQVIGILALMEAEALSERELASLKPSLMKGDAPRWQTLAFISMAPEERTQSLAAIRANLESPVWRHVLHNYSDKPVIEEMDLELFNASVGDELSDIDRVGWSLASWYAGAKPKEFTGRLQAWSQATTVPPASETLKQLAGDHADLCMAVLATTVTLRSPVSWVKPINLGN